MDIGKLKGNTKFYDGFEEDNEVVLSYVDNPTFNIHIYEGFFYDFFGEPSLDGKGWNGFTRDYNQMERAFGGGEYVISDVKEYLNDLLSYSEKKYEYEAVAECYVLLRDFLIYALESNNRILVQVI